MASSGEVTMRFETEPGEWNTYDHQKRSLHLKFFIDPPVLDRVVLQLPVETVVVGCFNDARGEDLERKPLRFDLRDTQNSCNC